jgi:hypothetical protein
MIEHQPEIIGRQLVQVGETVKSTLFKPSSWSESAV